MNLKLGLVSLAFLGILSGCAFRSQLPAAPVAFQAPEPQVFDAPFAPSPSYAATLEGGPHYTDGPELNRYMPKDESIRGARGRGLPPPVNAKEDGAAAEGEAAADKGAPVVNPPPAAPPPPKRPTVAKQSMPPNGSWGNQTTGRPGDPATASSF